MRLSSFRIKKYRSIEDSGEIKVDENITTFVGINESGKTNVLRALKKINHVSDTAFDDLTENPAWHYGRFDPGETFVSATFKLNKEEKEEIRRIDDDIILNEIKFSKKANMELACHLELDQTTAPFIYFTSYLSALRLIAKDIDPSIKNGDYFKQTITDLLNEVEHEIKNKPEISKLEILKLIKPKIKRFQKMISTIPVDPSNMLEPDSLLDTMKTEAVRIVTEPIKNYLISQLPRFVYFEDTGLIDSRIHLPTFIEKLIHNTLDEKDRAAKSLLDLGNLDANELLSLGSDEGERTTVQQNKARLGVMLSQASKKVSREIDRVWGSNDHDIEFSVHGDDLGVWVTDKRDGTRLQLEQKSRGYRWYFSFYTIFNAESERNHKNAVILLDEPALFLHVKGQQDLLNKTLPALAEKNQIIYTTHSPSMIDLTRPDSIHTVTLKEKEISGRKQRVSCISNEVWDSDRDALFPLQAALHYTMAQSMFIGRKNLIVEGVTDHWLLSSASSLLESAGKVHLKNGLVIVPASGATRSVLFASMYKSQDLDVAVLLDGDHQGRHARDSIVKSKILRGKKVAMVNEIFGESGDMSIEDVFPPDYYLKFVRAAYGNELEEKQIDSIVLDSHKPMITKQIGDFFAEHGLGEFHKDRPGRGILNELGKTNVGSLPPELVDNFETLFEHINRMMEPADEN